MSSASEMKVFVALLCAVAGAAASGAVAWPGAIPLSSPYHSTQIKTVIPPEIKGFAYSTSQYINAIPAQGYQPQFTYQISYPGYPSYSPILAASYYPSNTFLYPSPSPVAPAAPAPIGPIAPAQPPVQSPPLQQPAGDEDTAVIESADQQQQTSSESQSQPQSQNPDGSPSSLDSKNMPGGPQIPQLVPSFPFLTPGSNFPQLPQFPQLPPFPQQSPQFPQFPQLPQLPERPQFPQLPQVPERPQFPQLPQLPERPQFPQLPQTPSNPSLPQIPSIPSGNDDEDTVSVDAA